MTATSKCPHMNFHANVEIARIEDTGLKYAHLTIRCVDCGAPAKFRGLEWGMSPDRPMAAVGDEEARLPFLCDGDDYNGKSIGFSVRDLRSDPETEPRT